MKARIVDTYTTETARAVKPNANRN